MIRFLRIIACVFFQFRVSSASGTEQILSEIYMCEVIQEDKMFAVHQHNSPRRGDLVSVKGPFVQWGSWKGGAEAAARGLSEQDSCAL